MNILMDLAPYTPVGKIIYAFGPVIVIVAVAIVAVAAVLIVKAVRKKK